MKPEASVADACAAGAATAPSPVTTSAEPTSSETSRPVRRLESRPATLEPALR